MEAVIEVFTLRKRKHEWCLEKEESNRIYEQATNKLEVVVRSRAMLRKRKGVLVIRGRTGRAQAVQSFARRELTEEEKKAIARLKLTHRFTVY